MAKFAMLNLGVNELLGIWSDDEEEAGIFEFKCGIQVKEGFEQRRTWLSRFVLIVFSKYTCCIFNLLSW